MLIDFSHTATRKERHRYETNDTLDVIGQGPKPGPQKKRADHQQAVNKVLVMRKHVVNPNPRCPKKCDSESDRSKNVHDWNSNGDVGDE